MKRFLLIKWDVLKRRRLQLETEACERVDRRQRCSQLILMMVFSKYITTQYRNFTQKKQDKKHKALLQYSCIRMSRSFKNYRKRFGSQSVASRQTRYALFSGLGQFGICNDSAVQTIYEYLRARRAQKTISDKFAEQMSAFKLVCRQLKRKLLMKSCRQQAY